MGRRAPQAAVKRHLNKMAHKYPGVEFRVLYASNGETAILPVNPATGEPECSDPANFMPKPKIYASEDRQCCSYHRTGGAKEIICTGANGDR